MNQIAQMRRKAEYGFSDFLSEESVRFYIGTNDRQDFIDETLYFFTYDFAPDDVRTFMSVDTAIVDFLRDMAKWEYYKVDSRAKALLEKHIEELKTAKI